MEGLHLRAPASRYRLESLIHSLVDQSGHRNARVYVQVTRGVARRRRHVFPQRTKPSVVLYVEKAPGVGASRKVLRAITHEDERWKRCHLKALVLLPNVLARQAAYRAGADEAILLGPGRLVREGSSSNVFIVRHRTLLTHPLGPEILPGVSRQVVLDLARAEGLRVREAPFRLSTLLGADEVLLSSTSLEIAPVVRVDGRRIAGGRPGPVGGALVKRFRERVLGRS
jgi:D-alanine transaminase